MGGILLRQIQKTKPLPNLGRTVMLGPPNKGSEIVDKIGNMKIFKMLNGPASLQLGRERKVSRISWDPLISNYA